MTHVQFSPELTKTLREKYAIKTVSSSLKQTLLSFYDLYFSLLLMLQLPPSISRASNPWRKLMMSMKGNVPSSNLRGKKNNKTKQ